MQDLNTFTTLAEIAGVFVGFGALIAVRSDGPRDTSAVTAIRGVLSFGIWVIVAGLIPAVLNGYDIRGHELWLGSGFVGLAVLWGTIVVQSLAPENRVELAMARRAHLMTTLIALWPFVIVITGALIVILLGSFPDQEPALYLTAVVLGLFAAAAMLLMLVFSLGRSRAAERAGGPAA
jgi:hypothetical protein